MSSILTGYELYLSECCITDTASDSWLKLSLATKRKYIELANELNSHVKLNLAKEAVSQDFMKYLYQPENKGWFNFVKSKQTEDRLNSLTTFEKVTKLAGEWYKMSDSEKISWQNFITTTI